MGALLQPSPTAVDAYRLENGLQDQALLSTLSASPYLFLQPSTNLHTAALLLSKHYLDPLATSINADQTRTQQASRRKRKRGDGDVDGKEVLRIKKIHIGGFDIDQVWAQADRVLNAASAELERNIALAELDQEESDKVNGRKSESKKVRFADENLNDSGSEHGILGEENVDSSVESVDESGGDFSSTEDAGGRLEDEVDGDKAEDDEDRDEEVDADGIDDYDRMASSEDERQADTFVADPYGLNDGFFSIDNFNRQSEFLEQQDARGDPDDGAASDEEEVNWEADPLEEGAGINLEGGDDDDLRGDATEDNEDGPTFGDPDALSEDEDVDAVADEGELDGIGGPSNTNDIMYKEFFAPPARKASKKKRNKKSRDLRGIEQGHPGQREDDMQRTMDAVHRDLFEDDDPAAQSEHDLSDVDPSDSRSRRSNHEKRQAKITEEIRQLEVASVAKRDWTLSGEAMAAQRPLNSLLEEDLEFERTGKPVPVITAEVSESIEDLIKRRILAREFDEVVRRRPDDLVTGAQVRRGRFELEDTKNPQGLAELYEEDHLKKNDPNYVDVRNEKLKKEHKEIEELWRSVSAQLDQLSNWHYKPKPPQANIDIRVDAPTIAMEDVRPGAEAGASSMLAPQEIYRPGEHRANGGAAGDSREVVLKGGVPIRREEMSRDEKTRRRRREKERIRKAGGDVKQNVKDGVNDKGKKERKEKEGVVGDLKKGGVKLIGKKGEIRDVEGRKFRTPDNVVGAGRYKL